jgi:beta-fructofuranosidase
MSMSREVSAVESNSNTGIMSRHSDSAPVGDVIPFFDDGAYHLFTLTPPPGTLYFPERLRTTWRHLRSVDLVRWDQLPDALRPGGDGEPDSDGVWTGSVLRVDGLYSIFYTGHSLKSATPQSICRATSTDGIAWSKDPKNPVSVPDLERFEGRDWRDPFVFWNEAEQRYWMLLSARSAAHPAVSRGVVALQTSTDLITWSPAEELCETFLTHCPECPEVFQLGDKWVMGYSRFTDRRGTVYRVADSPRGPWRHFGIDGPDGANWYAAKSLTDSSGRRIAFGWVPDRNPHPSEASGEWLWAGDLAVPRELRLDAADQLEVHLPNEVEACVYAAATSRCEHNFGTGNWTVSPDQTGFSYDVESVGHFGYCILRPENDTDSFILSVTVHGAKDAAAVGLIVQTNEQLDSGIAILCYPHQQRVSAIDVTAARSELANEYEKATTEYASVTEGSVRAAKLDPLTLRIVVRKDLVEAFVANSTTLTYRLRLPQTGAIALVVEDGTARFTNLEIGYLVASSRADRDLDGRGAPLNDQ